MVKSIQVLCGLFIAFSAASHPYDEPLTFREHKTDDGRPIFSNIPKACFSEGRLTCDQLHPIFGMPVSTKKTVSSTTKKTSNTRASNTRTSAAASGPAVKLSDVGNICHAKGSQWYNQTTTNFTPFTSMGECQEAQKAREESSN